MGLGRDGDHSQPHRGPLLLPCEASPCWPQWLAAGQCSSDLKVPDSQGSAPDVDGGHPVGARVQHALTIFLLSEALGKEQQNHRFPPESAPV